MWKVGPPAMRVRVVIVALAIPFGIASLLSSGYLVITEFFAGGLITYISWRTPLILSAIAVIGYLLLLVMWPGSMSISRMQVVIYWLVVTNCILSVFLASLGRYRFIVGGAILFCIVGAEIARPFYGRAFYYLLLSRNAFSCNIYNAYRDR